VLARVRAIAAATASVGLACVLVVILAPVVLAEGDTTPPSGTLTINGGAPFTNSTTLLLTVPATDDVGVVEVRIGRDGSDWSVYPYTSEIDWSLDAPGAVADGAHTVDVAWFDAAGNSSTGTGTITVDRQAPRLSQIRAGQGSSPLSVAVSASDVGSGLTSVRFSSDGASWGSWLPKNTEQNEYIGWDPFDPGVGGVPVVGERTIYAQVRDGALNVSGVVSDDALVMIDGFTLAVSPNPRTGDVITLTPALPAGYSFAAGSVCR